MYYKNPEFSRFFAPNSSRYAPTRFFRGFRREYLTSPTPIFVFLYNMMAVGCKISVFESVTGNPVAVSAFRQCGARSGEML